VCVKEAMVVFGGFDLPCTEEAPTCMETCGQLRACGRHRCMEHCHVGPCSTVRVIQPVMLTIHLQTSFCSPPPPLPVDSFRAMMTVWRLGGKIIRTVLYCIVYNSGAHTHVNSS